MHKSIRIGKKEYLTAAGYARKHGVSRQRVHQWVMGGRFEGVKRLPLVLIPADAPYPRDLRVAEKE